MRLLTLHALHYRSLRDQDIDLDDLNVFIGANASGKSTILDALRFLSEGVRGRDLRVPVFARGGIVHLAWKGEAADRIELVVRLRHEDTRYEWSVCLVRSGYEFHVVEQVLELPDGRPPVQLLDASAGEGWWWSGKDERVELKQDPTSCALAAAAADASFPARDVAEFIGRWGFFDPNPFLLRRDWTGLESGRFDHYGRNLGEKLYALKATSPAIFERIMEATRAVLGLPSAIEPRESEEGRFYFAQFEPGLQYPVHQMGVSSGTLRMLALMTALFAEPDTNLIGIEGPENYVHPAALASFVDYLLHARNRVQFMVTTHSPLLLDFLNKPEAVRVVRRSERGTSVVEGENPDNVRKALEASGFGLGAFYETKGFGSSSPEPWTRPGSPSAAPASGRSWPPS